MPAKIKHITMQEYLDKNNLAKIVIKNHCHGVRIEIEENWRIVVSVVEPNIDLAWNKALNALPKGRDNKAQQEIKKYQEWIIDKQKEIDDYKENIVQLKKLLPKRRKNPVVEKTIDKLI